VRDRLDLVHDLVRERGRELFRLRGILRRDSLVSCRNPAQRSRSTRRRIRRL